jgi:hypothetical protein
MKGLFIALVLLLVSYAPLELSRLIFAYGLAADTIFELCFIWGGFALSIFLLIRYIRVD